MKGKQILKLCLLCCLLSLFWVHAGAAEVVNSGQCGRELTWTLTDDDVLTISGTGAMWDYYDPFSRPPWYAAADTIRTVVVEQGVTALGRFAFGNCTALTEVSLPDSLTALGEQCFRDCKLLPGIVIPAGVTAIPAEAFWGCSSLTRVELPEGLTTLGRKCFLNCALPGIDLPESLTTLEDGCFSGCGLETISLPAGITALPAEVFERCASLTQVDLPTGLLTLGEDCFANCESLPTISLPAGVTAIPDHAFDRCLALERIELPEGLVEIGRYAFELAGMNSGSLTIDLPESLTTIGSSAFSRSSLSSIHIPGSVTKIGACAFYDCPLLSNVTFDDGALSIGNSAFYRSSITWLELPEGLVEIGEDAFSQCFSLTELTVRPGPTVIGTGAFSSCALTRVELPEGLTTIGENAFSGNDITYLRIPASLTTVAEDAFQYCDEIAVIYYPGGSAQLWAAISIAAAGNEGLTAERLFFEPGVIASGSCGDNISWTLDSEGTLTVSGEGRVTSIDYATTSMGNQMPYISGYYPWFDYRRMVRTLVLEEGITHVGERAFWEFQSLTQVSFPSTLLAIEEEACVEWSLLPRLELPEGLTFLGDYAFSSCYTLKEVTIPAPLTHIGAGVFEFCPGLEEIRLRDGNSRYMVQNGALFTADGRTLLQYPAARAEQEFSIPEGTVYIAEGAFRNSLLAEITFPEGLTTIGKAAFADCDRLLEADLPDTLTALRERAFSGCVKLARVTLPEGLLEMGERVFAACSDLEEITIPASVQVIGDEAFYFRTALKGYEGSYAQQYAGLYDFPFTSLGDREREIPLWQTSGLFANEKLSRPQIAALISVRPEPVSPLYAEEPLLTAPYSGGTLTDEVPASVLNWLNALRNIAGVNGAVLDAHYNRLAQDSALVQRLLGRLDHHPAQPEGMGDGLYASAFVGSQSSNLAMGQDTLMESIDAYMRDNNASNVDAVGHRRWLINPAMTAAGFGQVDYCYAGVVHDRCGTVSAYDFVSWPASGNFPAGQFEGSVPWSVSLNPDRYKKPVEAAISVTLTEVSTGRSWTFSGEKAYDINDREYFNVDTGGYGSGSAVIFRPDGVNTYEGLYTVTIDGLQDVNGLDAQLSFYVNFFDETEADPDADSGFITEGLFWERDRDGTLSVTGVNETPGKLVLAVYRNGKMTAVDAVHCGGLETVELSCPCPDGAEAKLFRLDDGYSPLNTAWRIQA